ncbi:MAG: LLM class flavin-dependent oxidoreductase [Chloroflexi bacterium]|nr:LLM class flavin-dependent oxidoreductase [Chloroflexota bacterium]MDA1004262.1 LLM class flavin-dependent oxidoreductase [Chloroflexota bacterium]
MFGVAIQAANAREAVEQIAQAERAGVDAAWATMFGGGGADLLPIYAAAAMRTERILMGTAILHTWGRQPLIFAQEAAALDELAPGRFRLGIGSTTAFFVERSYGMVYRKPLLNLREYLVTVRALLREGSVDFSGEHVSARARLSRPAAVPVMASALRPKSYALCGELSDGAISWMSPLKYLVGTALPTMQAAAAAAGRATPPLVAHVPIAVTTDRAEARAMARAQLAMYARVPNYQGMFAMAGYEVDGEYPDDLLDDLVVSGTEQEVAAGLRRWRDAGMGEILAHPLLDPNDRERSLARSFAAVAAARG